MIAPPATAFSVVSVASTDVMTEGPESRTSRIHEPQPTTYRRRANHQEFSRPIHAMNVDKIETDYRKTRNTSHGLESENIEDRSY